MLIKRTDSSSYFPENFFEQERKRIESETPYQYLSPYQELSDDDEIILITNTHTQLENWQHLKDQVKLIIHPNSGFENLNTQNWTTPVVLGNSIRAQAVAQWCLSILYQETCVVRHQSTWPLTRHHPRRLTGEIKILIVGQGHIGSILKTHLPRAHVFDPWLGIDLDLKQSWDVVIMAASSNPANQAMINADFLSHCSQDLLLINPARGELVSKKDLEDFLGMHPHARAYMDVHQQEPYPASFYQTTQVIGTPHIAGVWDGLIESMLAFEVSVLKAFQQKAIPQDWLLESRKTPQGFYR